MTDTDPTPYSMLAPYDADLHPSQTTCAARSIMVAWQDRIVHQRKWQPDIKTVEDRNRKIEALCTRPNGDLMLLEPAWFEHIDDRELEFLFLRFVENRHLQDIGDTVGSTRERVRQIINISVRKLTREAKLARPTFFRRSQLRVPCPTTADVSGQ